MMSQNYAGSVLRSPLVQSAEIDNASSNWQTVYELASPTTSHKTYKRCITSMNAVFSEIELLVRTSWESHRSALKAEGHALL
jgi:chromosome partitioning protein